MTEAELKKLFSKTQSACLFFEVSTGDKSIFGSNSTDRKIDIVIFLQCRRWCPGIILQTKPNYLNKTPGKNLQM